MKLSEIPEAAFNTPSTSIPTKEVYDWDALYAILMHRGFVIIESDNIRGEHDCVEVKAFNCHIRQVKKVGLKTKRISRSRWFCCL